ncbi:MAG: flagellar export protein FliJ [Peptostreptococcaceae bacterium]
MAIKFKLQKLLDIRIKEEDESKILYGKAQNQKALVEKKLRDLEEDYNNHRDITRFEDIVSQKIAFNYLDSILQAIEKAKLEIEKEEKNVLKTKQDFIEKQIKRKSLETLKENQAEKIKKEEERIEAINNDEFALYAYIRNREE